MEAFIVYGKPQGKARPRFSRKSGTVYTPKQTAQYEKEIANEYKLGGGTCFPIDVYVGVHIRAFFPVPKSWSKKAREMAEMKIIRPTSKPDADNVGKVVLDALNGVAYEDDRQVVKLSIEKFYSEIPFISVEVFEVKE